MEKEQFLFAKNVSFPSVHQVRAEIQSKEKEEEDMMEEAVSQPK